MELKPEDLSICSWSSKQPGGWSVGVPNGVKVVHKPSGWEMCCDNERSQHRNKAKCIEALKEYLKTYEPEYPSNEDWIKDIMIMDVWGLLALVMESPDLLSDGYYRVIGSAIEKRYAQLRSENG